MVYCGKYSRNTPARYKCFRKGVGLGLRMSRKSKSEMRKMKSERKIYCGTKTYLPHGYTKLGNKYECLRRGISKGRSLKRRKTTRTKRRRR